jgi:hypothetical protein
VGFLSQLRAKTIGDPPVDYRFQNPELEALFAPAPPRALTANDIPGVLSLLGTLGLAIIVGATVSAGIESGYGMLANDFRDAAGNVLKYDPVDHPILDGIRFALGSIAGAFVGAFAARSRAWIMGTLLALIPFGCAVAAVFLMPAPWSNATFWSLLLTGLGIVIATLYAKVMWDSDGPAIDPTRRTVFGIRKRAWVLLTFLPIGSIAAVLPQLVLGWYLDFRAGWHQLVNPHLWINPLWYFLFPIASGLIFGVPFVTWSGALGGMLDMAQETSPKRGGARLATFCGWWLAAVLIPSIGLALGVWVLKLLPG